MTPFLALLAMAVSPSWGASAYNAHGFTLVPSDGDLHDPLAMWRPEVQVKHAFGLSLLGEYARMPLVQYTNTLDGLQQRALVDNLLGLNVGGTFAVDRRLALSLEMPLWATAQDTTGATHAALGDIRFAMPIGLVLPRKDRTDPNAANAA